MYSVQSGEFRTPRGATVTLNFRADTNDADVLRSCLNEDEYGLRDLYLSGHALDVGAHIGGASVALLVDNPDLMLICLEPVIENEALLIRNLVAAGVRHRALLPMMAAGGEGEHTLDYSVLYHGSESAARHSFVANQTMPADTFSERRTASATSLSEVTALWGDLSFAKIDCEGCEYAFLDSPALRRVERIRGEYHRGRLATLLEATHAVTYDGDEGVGLFYAIRR